MKVFMLSLVMLIGVSFAGNTLQAAGPGGCTNCWDYAEGARYAGGDDVKAYNYCMENLDPCMLQLDEVIIKL